MAWYDKFKAEFDALAHKLDFASAIGTFDDPLWHAQKRALGVEFQKGEFIGVPEVATSGGRNYLYKQSEPKFAFRRFDGELIYPKAMVTDGGSIPRVAWVIPGLDPWTYMPAYLIHDWDFMAHHANPAYPRSFEEVNLTLAEGVYTLMMNGVGKQDWRILLAIYLGVSSPIGRRVWDASWPPEAILAAMPEGV